MHTINSLNLIRDESAYVFVYDSLSSEWTFLQKLNASNDGSFGDGFARSVGIYKQNAVVGSVGFRSNSVGAIYFYSETQNGWIETSFVPGPLPNALYAFKVGSMTIGSLPQQSTQKSPTSSTSIPLLAPQSPTSLIA